MQSFVDKHRTGVLGMILFTVSIFALAIFTNGTGDEGDSITHYLIARYALQYPYYFFHHWAKPLYVLIAFPFAQSGFMGVKLMNTGLSCITLWLTYLTARQLGYRWAPWVFVAAVFFKLFLIAALSGLTEPLHAAMLAAGIYLSVRRQFVWAAIIISFLPFVRSEGLCIIAVYAGYLLLSRRWRYIPLLAAGHIVYSIAGYPYFHDLLWVFNKIPYLNPIPHYGHGTWTYYPEQMPQMIGLTGSLVMLIGSFFIILPSGSRLIRLQAATYDLDRLLIAALFFAFFFMHMVLWALGTNGSFGMIRVFAAVAGPMLILIVAGMEGIDRQMARIPYHSTILALVYITVASLLYLLPNQYSLHPRRDFGLHADQLCDRDAATYIENNIPGYKSYNYYFDALYLAEILQIDINDPRHFARNNEIPDQRYPTHSIIIWDDWYTAFERGIPLSAFRADTTLTELKIFERPGDMRGKRRVVLFIKKP